MLTRRLVAFAFVALSIWAQAGGRLEEPKRKGLSLIREYRFDKAAGYLEEVWEQDQRDPTIAENLAMAYLNCEDRRTDAKLVERAVALMEKAIELGGQATFVVHLSREKMTAVAGREYNDYCSGRLTFRPGRLAFVVESCDNPQSSFDLDRSEIRSFEFLDKDARGTVRVKSKDKTYILAPRTGLRQDGALINEFAKKYLTVAR